MTILYKVCVCPRCKQDYLYIVLDKTAQALYVSCAECEASWHHPDDIIDSKKIFVDLSIDAIDPSEKDIKDKGWERYVFEILVVQPIFWELKTVGLSSEVQHLMM